MKQSEYEQLEAWAEAVRLSDRRAFDKLFRYLYPQLVPFAARYTKQKSAACDIVQESFIKLWQMRTNIDPAQSVKAYLFKMVRNRSLNWLRNQDHQTVLLMDENEFEMIKTTDDQTQKNHQLAELFKTWIDELPDRQQEAFELSRFDGLDHDEIAQVMEVSPKTVNNHIVAALRYLRECYTNHQQKMKQS